MNIFNSKAGTPRGMALGVLGALVLLAVALYACAPATPAPVPTQVPPTEVPSATPLPDQSAYFTAWAANPMRAVYDLGRGPNTMCSRCHSPLNWIPGSKTGTSPNCVTCKFFAMDKELRHAPTFAEGGMDFVSEADWQGITCKNCHQVDPATGYVNPEPAWLQPVSLVYEKINEPNDLCAKCHASPAGTSVGASGGAASHLILLGGSAHLNYAGEWPQADRPDQCTDCHDIHTGEYKECVDCHTDTAATHTKVAAMMGNVSCLACHASDVTAAAPMQFQADLPQSAVEHTNMKYRQWTTVKDPAKAVWVPVTVATSRTGALTTSYTLSHSIQWAVSCDRCHKAGNTYGLSVRTAAGALVPTATPKPATSGTPGAATTGAATRPAATATK